MFSHKIGYFPVSIHGFSYIGVILLLSFVSFPFSYYFALLFVALSGFLSFFFRDPKRSVPRNDALVLSPADGVVSSVEVVESPLGDSAYFTRVSIFLSFLDVHINRTPVAGVVKSVTYQPGQFFNALRHKSVTKNEMFRTVFETHLGNHTVIMEQIAGFFARRAVCDLREREWVKLGTRMGIIKFGSRVNIFLPPGVTPMVVKGQRVRAGETVLGHLDPKPNQKQRFQYDRF